MIICWKSSKFRQINVILFLLTGVTVFQDSRSPTTSLILSTTPMSFTKASIMPPPKHLSKFYRFYVDQLFQTQQLIPTPSFTSPPLPVATSKLSVGHFQLWTDSDEVDRVFHTFHRIARTAFICLMVLGVVMAVGGISFYWFLRHRRNYVHIKAEKARERLKLVIALV